MVNIHTDSSFGNFMEAVGGGVVDELELNVDDRVTCSVFTSSGPAERGG